MGRIVKLATKADRKRPCDKDLKRICSTHLCWYQLIAVFKTVWSLLLVVFWHFSVYLVRQDHLPQALIVLHLQLHLQRTAVVTKSKRYLHIAVQYLAAHPVISLQLVFALLHIEECAS